MAKFTALIYGPTGTGKSGLFQTFARGLWEEKKLKTRLVGFEKAQTEPLVREGINAGYIIPWWMTDKMDAQGNPETPFERFTDAVLGKWPADPTNPYSNLVPAFSIQYKAVCANIEKHVDKQPVLVYQGANPATNASTLKCPKCSQAVMQETIRVISDERLKEVGAYFLDGLTEGGDVLMNNMSQRAAKGEQLGGGERGGVSVRFQDGALWIASSTQASYGIAQRQCKNKVDESKHLPVDYVLWSAGFEEGKDYDRGGVMVFGPKIPGTAATADVPRWFGPTLATMAVPVGLDGAQKTEYRIYLKEFYQTWVPLIAKQKCMVNNRIPPGNLKGIPDFVNVNYEQAAIDVAGLKMNPRTLLWEITKLIEQRQNPGGGK
jgi:hypothetical protein